MRLPPIAHGLFALGCQKIGPRQLPSMCLKRPMPKLSEVIADAGKKAQIVDECLKVVDLEVADKGGISGIAVKAGYRAIQGIKPGFVKGVVEDLMPDFAKALDPMFEEANVAGKSVTSHFAANPSRVANALLSITDAKAARSTGMIKKTYDGLRGLAQKNVESAVPRLGALVEKFTS